AYRSSDQTWYGFGARVRVIVVNTEVLSDPSAWPRRLADLADSKWQGRAGIAKPLFGTTATHAAVLFHLWGAERAKAFFDEVRQNAKVLAGNRQVAIAVARGQLAWGVTDTDDAYQVQQQGYPVAIVFPDQDGDGALVIPNTVAIVKGAPHAAEAEAFVDYLLSVETEGQLAEGPSAQFPLHPRGQTPSPVARLDEIHPLAVDFEAAAAAWEPAAAFLRQRF
ncbi:MAG: extracellular solute-binding protein, partial [Planctomycetota bacterium]